MNLQTNLTELTDDEVQVKAIIWRREALHGNKKAFSLPHLYETESRRRANAKGGTGFGTLDAVAVPIWRRMLFWRSPVGSELTRQA